MTRLHAVLISLAALAAACASPAQSFSSPGPTDGGIPVSADQTQALLSQIAQSFIPGYAPSSPGTTASLLANYPATPSMAGKYAVVSDLFGNTNEVLRAGCTGSNCYWRPQRTDFATSTVASGGTLTLTPLQNAPFQYLTGQLASSLTINLSATNAWPGASFCVSNNLTLGLFNLTLTGTGLPSTNMLAGASKCAYFDGASWRPF